MPRTVSLTRGGRTVAAAAFVVALLAGGVAEAASPLPTPGTAAQVSALVAASVRIQRLPTNLVPSVAQATSDNPGTYYPATRYGCTTLTGCVFGDVASKSVVVLLGDSHAQMWLPSLIPLAAARHLRLVLLWKSACPAADVVVWNSVIDAPYADCTSWRAAQLRAIHQLAPAVVLLADRTTSIFNSHDQLTTDAAWQAGLEETITAVSGKRTKVGVIGDITPFSALLPECLASYPSRVQNCSQRSRNPSLTGHFAAERAAAAARHVPYVDPTPLLCTSTTCSPVIGNMIAYFDSLHVSTTYAAYLSTALGASLVRAGLFHA
jgi:hypothetical protein